jgi:hypothetical protein
MPPQIIDQGVRRFLRPSRGDGIKVQVTDQKTGEVLPVQTVAK